MESVDFRRLNFRDDFTLRLVVRSCNGRVLGWPAWDWEAVFWTGSKANCYVASSRGGVNRNCRPVDGGDGIEVVFDNHRLSPGVLKVEFRAFLPDGVYPGGDKRVVVPEELGVLLVREAGDCPSEVEAEVVLPTLKGDPMTWGSMSDEDRAAMLESFAEYAGMESCVALEEDEFEDMPQSGKKASDPTAWRKGCGIVPNTLAYGMMPLHPYPGVVYKMQKWYSPLEEFSDVVLQIKLRVGGEKYNAAGGYGEIDIPEHLHTLFDECIYHVYLPTQGQAVLVDAQYDQQTHRLRIYCSAETMVLCFTSPDPTGNGYLRREYYTGYVSLNAKGNLIKVCKGDIYFRPKRSAAEIGKLEAVNGKYEVDVYRSFMHINKYDKSEKKVYRWGSVASRRRGRFDSADLVAFARTRLLWMMRIRRSAKYEWSYLFSFYRWKDPNRKILKKLKTGPFLRRKVHITK